MFSELLRITNKDGVSFGTASNVYSVYPTTSDKDIFESVIDGLILERYATEDIKEYIKSLPIDKKRVATLSVIGDDHVLWSKMNDILKEEKSGYRRLKDIYLLLKDYVKIADVERKKHGEILTPFKELAEPMIRLVEKYDSEFWKNKNHKVLDSSAGYGTFLILAAYKFMVGLKDEIPDEEERFKWVIENCLYYGELQAKSVFSWLVAIDPYNEYKTNIYWGSFLTKDFDNHMKNVWNVESFDLIIQNPPYQEVVGPKKTQQVWAKFVKKSFSILKENGYMDFVHPGGWRFITDRSMDDIRIAHNIYKENNIIYAEFHTYQDGKKIFGVETDYDIIFLKKSKSENSTIKTNTDGLVDLNLSDFKNIIPTDNIKLYKKLTNSEEKVEFLYSRSLYGSDKVNVSKYISDKFKNPIVYGFPMKGLSLIYSNNNVGHFGIKKLILIRASLYSILDLDGKYGLSQYTAAIVDDEENLYKIKQVIDSDKFKKLKSYFLGVVSQNVNAPIDALGNMFKVIREFKKDFWKELL